MKRWAFVVGPILVFISSSAWTQSATTPQPSSAPLRSLVVVAAPQKATSPVALALRPDDFELKENGKPVIVKEVRSLGRVPIHYCILVDASKSEQGLFAGQQDAASELLRTSVRSGTDRGWVLVFNDVGQESSETTNPELLINVISQGVPTGGTSLYDAMLRCAMRMAKSENDPSPRFMFLFSDGEDNASHVNSERVIDSLLMAGVRVYALYLRPAFDPSGPPTERGETRLTTFSESTGGRMLRIGDRKGIGPAVAQVTEDLQHLFEITHTPTTLAERGKSTKISLKTRAKGIRLLFPERRLPQN